MASNSTENPAPIVKLDVFNNEIWSNTSKTLSVGNSNLVYTDIAVLDRDNTYISNNTYNNDVCFNNTIQYSNFYLNSVYNLPINFFSFALPTPLSSFYTYRNTTVTGVLSLPNPSIDFQNCYITFKRISGSRNLVSANANINNITTLTVTNEILAGSSYIVTIACIYNSVSATYGWYMVYKT